MFPAKMCKKTNIASSFDRTFTFEFDDSSRNQFHFHSFSTKVHLRQRISKVMRNTKKKRRSGRRPGRLDGNEASRRRRLITPTPGVETKHTHTHTRAQNKNRDRHSVIERRPVLINTFVNDEIPSPVMAPPPFHLIARPIRRNPKLQTTNHRNGVESERI